MPLCGMAFVSKSDLISACLAHPIDLFCSFLYYFFAKVTKQTKICIKRGAISKALLKYMHPSILSNDTFTNYTVKTVIKDMLVIFEEKRVVKSREQTRIIFCHPRFENIKVYCVNWWVKDN